jgi:hypothetical protein
MTLNINCMPTTSNYTPIWQNHDIAVIRRRLGDCTLPSQVLVRPRRLQINGDKHEIYLVQLALGGQDLTLPIGSDVVQPHSVVRDLGIGLRLDSELTRHHHITRL